jgi:hypothetical protein
MFLSDGTFNRNTRLEIWNFLFHPKPLYLTRQIWAPSSIGN